MAIAPIIIDLEASGFGPHSYPIEVGVALADTTTACYLIRPQPDWNHWDMATEHVHGLKRAILQQHGKPVREVATALNALLGTQLVYSDAWGFDQTWLSRLFEAANVRQQFRVQALQTLFAPQHYDLWNNVKDRVLVESKLTRHRASSDAQLIQLTWQRLSNLASSPK